MKTNRQKRLPFLILALLLSTMACQFATDLGSTLLDDETTAVSATAVLPNEPVQDDEVDAAEETAVTQPVATLAPALHNTQNNPIMTTDLEQTLVQVYQRVNPAVVHIFIFDEDNFLAGTGSGFIIDNAGHAVTNNHVIAGAAAIEVVFSDGQRRRSQLVGADVDSDLAVIQIEDVPAGITPVPLGDSNALQVGQFVVAIGHPFGEEGSMSVGIISALDRTISSQRVVNGGTFSIPQVIQTDAAINPGNSGGPLLNLNGEVVAVNSAILTRTGENSGVGFSIPVNAVRRIAPALIENGAYAYPFMGISMWPEPFTLNQLEALELPPNGVYVTNVGANTPAGDAGLVGSPFPASTADGDYIIAVDGNPVRDSDELLSYLVFETEVGQTINLTVLRDGRELNLPLTLGERP